MAQAINNAGLGITAKVLSGARVQIDTTGNPNVVYRGGQWTSANGGNIIIPATGNKFAGPNVVGTPGVASPGGIQNQVVTFEPSTSFLASTVADRIDTAIDASPLFGTMFPFIDASSGNAGGPDQRRVPLTGPNVTFASTVPGLALELANTNAIVGNNVMKQHEDLLRLIDLLEDERGTVRQTAREEETSAPQGDRWRAVARRTEVEAGVVAVPARAESVGEAPGGLEREAGDEGQAVAIQQPPAGRRQGRLFTVARISPASAAFGSSSR